MSPGPTARPSTPSGAPGGVDLTGRSVPEASPVGPAAPLKLELARPGVAGRPSASGSRGALNLMPPPPERKSRLSDGIEQAGKPDCRTAHAGKGLLGVVPLAQATLGKDGDCRW